MKQQESRIQHKKKGTRSAELIPLKNIHVISKCMKYFMVTSSIIITSCILTGCGIQNTESKTPSGEATETMNDVPSASEQYLCEATPTAALTVKMEADIYFVENKSDNKIFHDFFHEDGGFGSDMLSRHSALAGLEYVIELNRDCNVVNVFLCQSKAEPVTMACLGDHDSIEDWGFSSWEQVLAHYNLTDDNSTESE